MFEYARCDWKDRRGKRCDQWAVAIRDLGPAYGTVRMQYACTQHLAVRHPTDELEDLRDATGGRA